jgi:hypothetical protein
LIGDSLGRGHQFSVLFDVFAKESLSFNSPFHIFSGDPSWSEHISNVFEQTRTCADLPASTLCMLSDVYVNNHAIYFGGSIETTMLYELHRPNDRPSVAINHNVHLRNHTKINSVENDEAVFYIGSAGSANYGHWLVDDMPRLKALEVFIEYCGSTNIRLLLPEFSAAYNEVRAQGVRSLFAKHKFNVTFIDPAVLFHFDRLYYVTPVSYHPKFKLRAAIEFVRNKALVLGSESNEDMIFVKRPGGGSRIITNSQEVENFLVNLGFKVISPESMSFADQVNCFSRAKLVVGIMGAGMTNSIFTRSGVPIIYLSVEWWVEPFYWDLACACSHPYYCVYGKQDDKSCAPHLSPFTIDLEMLTLAITAASSKQARSVNTD